MTACGGRVGETAGMNGSSFGDESRERVRECCFSDTPEAGVVPQALQQRGGHDGGLSGVGPADAVRAMADLGENSHLVDLGHRTTFFMPAAGGRLSVYQLEDQPPSMDLTYDDDAGPRVATGFLSVLGLPGP